VNNTIPDFIREPHDAYNEQRATHLTSTALKDYIKSPAIFRAKRDGTIPQRSSSAMDFGTAVHKYVLEGRREFERYYVVSDGPVNDKTGEAFGAQTKTHKAWRESVAPLEIISTADGARIEAMHASVHAHDEAAELLSNGTAEGVVRADLFGVASQARIDWYHFQRGLVDLKTTKDLDGFADQYDDLDYGVQAAFYQAVFEAANGYAPDFHFVAIEKQAPYRCGVFRIGGDEMGSLRDRVERLVRDVAEAIDTETFPTGYEQVITLGGES
jgi:hypothetical protein